MIPRLIPSGVLAAIAGAADGGRRIIQPVFRVHFIIAGPHRAGHQGRRSASLLLSPSLLPAYIITITTIIITTTIIIITTTLLSSLLLPSITIVPTIINTIAPTLLPSLLLLPPLLLSTLLTSQVGLATTRVPVALTEDIFQGALTAHTLTWRHRKNCEGALAWHF